MNSQNEDLDESVQETLSRRHLLGTGVGLTAVSMAMPVLAQLAGRQTACTHVITLRNVAASTTVTHIRISAATPGTQILNSTVPAGWVQTPLYPSSVVWRPAGGGFIPQGDPLPATFSIDVHASTQPGKSVLVEWLSDREPACQQILLVPCGDVAVIDPRQRDKMLAGSGTRPPPKPEYCRCLSAETDADPDSEQYAEPDLEVTLGTATSAGFLKVAVPYTIEAEPPQLQFTRQWAVTRLDALQEEQPITVPIADNLNGLATFTLPGRGEYSFYLTVTDPAGCVGREFLDPDEYSDVDVAAYREDGTPPVIGYSQTDRCDPRWYEFRDDSSSPGNNPIWTFTGPNFTAGATTSPASIYLPNIGDTYQISLVTTDPATGSPQPSNPISVTPTAPAVHVDFDWKPYNSCVTSNFVVSFVNLSTNTQCPVIFHWDFGDSTYSSAEAPVHTYAQHGPHQVTLTMTVPGFGAILQVMKTIMVQNWSPTFTATVCNNGSVLYTATGPAGSGQCQLEWSFPNGHYDIDNNDALQMLVCYDAPGTYGALLTATNPDKGKCTPPRTMVTVTAVSHACPRGVLVKDNVFNYNGKQYQMRSKLKFHGRFLRSVRAKTKLRVHTGIGYVRKRADTISLSVTGSITPKSSTLCTGGDSTVTMQKSRQKRAKVGKNDFPGIGSFGARQWQLNCVHTVKVDANHSGYSYTTSVAVNPCGCDD